MTRFVFLVLLAVSVLASSLTTDTPLQPLVSHIGNLGLVYGGVGIRSTGQGCFVVSVPPQATFVTAAYAVWHGRCIGGLSTECKNKTVWIEFDGGGQQLLAPDYPEATYTRGSSTFGSSLAADVTSHIHLGDTNVCVEETPHSYKEFHGVSIFVYYTNPALQRVEAQLWLGHDFIYVGRDAYPEGRESEAYCFNVAVTGCHFSVSFIVGGILHSQRPNALYAHSDNGSLPVIGPGVSGGSFSPPHFWDSGGGYSGLPNLADMVEPVLIAANFGADNKIFPHDLEVDWPMRSRYGEELDIWTILASVEHDDYWCYQMESVPWGQPQGTVINGQSVGPGASIALIAHSFFIPQPCPLDCVLRCDDECVPPFELRTQTQGGWGGSGAPAAYLFANFAAAFPAGVTLGGSPESLHFATAVDVNSFLPEGGTPGPLPDTNVLTGQLLAAVLNVGFDRYDPVFGAGDLVLGEMIVPSCFSWTVDALIAEAHSVVSGAGSAVFTASQINDCLTTVNEEFVDGAAGDGDVVPVGCEDPCVCHCATPTPTATVTATATSTATSTATATATVTSTATSTATVTATVTATSTATTTATETATATATETATSTATTTATVTSTATSTATTTATETATVTATSTATTTATATSTATETATVTSTATTTATVTSTATSTATETATVTATSTATETATVTSTPTPLPSTPTPLSRGIPTPQPTPQPTPTPPPCGLNDSHIDCKWCLRNDDCVWINCGKPFKACVHDSLIGTLPSNVTEHCDIRFDSCSHSSAMDSSSSLSHQSFPGLDALAGALGGLLTAAALFGGLTLGLMAYRRHHEVPSLDTELVGDDDFVVTNDNPVFSADETGGGVENPAYEGGET